jgi:catechol 2,3-dioxygenase-like lactoylglutathione lyase family enzyme
MGQFDHVAFQVGNMDAAIQFYVEKLGFTLSSRAVNQEEREEFAFVALGDLRLELIQDLSRAAYQKPGIEPPYCPHLAIETDNMERAVARLREKGVPIVRGPLVIEDEVTWVYLADPDNNVLEYVQWYT